jgi:putative membrane protein
MLRDDDAGREMRASPSGEKPLLERMIQLAIRIWCWRALRQRVDLRVEGIRHLPRRGPVLIVCRHYHHYYDGCLMLATLPRPVHILVALDWIDKAWIRAVMDAACRLARWPVVLRDERLSGDGATGGSAYRAGERRPYLKRAMEQVRGLLGAGEALVIFPEAYPTIDPIYTPKTADDAYLPFRRGFIRMVEIAQRDGHTRVAIVPAGLHYRRAGERWRVRLRFGSALYLEERGNRAELLRLIEEQVRSLSSSSSFA